MKKLTAGIFTVLLGVVAANSADAALTSQKYVDAKVKVNADAIADLTTTVGTKAAASTVTALSEKVTANTDAIATKADSATVTAELAKKQDKLVSTDNVVINADNTITLKGVATDSNLSDLQKTVEQHTTDIEKNTGAITTLNGADTVENSVAYKIKNALTNYTTTTDMNAKLDLKADKTDIADMETKTNASATYATKTEMNAVDGKFANYTNTTDMNSALDLKADKTTIGEVEAGKTVVQMIKDAETSATYDDTTIKADIKKNADAITTINDSDVMKSGIDAEKVAQIDTNTTGVAANKTAVEAVTKDLADNYTKTASLSDLAKATIPTTCTDPNAANGCALILKNGVYSWEVVERADGE